MFCLFFYDSKILHLLLPMSRTNPGKLQVFIGFPLIQNKAKGVPDSFNVLAQKALHSQRGQSLRYRTASQVSSFSFWSSLNLALLLQ